MNMRKAGIPKPRNILELFQEEQDQGRIVTFCQKLDTMLGGGISLGKITEFFGVPGIGKTQICMQLAVDTHIPENLGGLAGEVVYIDTEGSFIVERLVDIAMATVEHCQNLGQEQGSQEGLQELTVDRILSGIHYFRCRDHTEVMAVVHLLPKFLREHGKVKLVVVDSIANPFRNSVEDPSLRSQLLALLAQTLNRLATQHHLAVVLTNQMTTRVKQQEGTSYLVPALGDSWGHACSVRVMLRWRSEQRCAILFKSTNVQSQICSFAVTSAGIRDSTTVIESSSTSSEHREIAELGDAASAHDQEMPSAPDFANSAVVDEKNRSSFPPLKRQKTS